MRTCRLCGCTETTACEMPDGGGWWVEPDLCSACQPVSRTARIVMVGGRVALVLRRRYNEAKAGRSQAPKGFIKSLCAEFGLRRDAIMRAISGATWRNV